MSVNLLNDNQQRRLSSHLRLLASDLDALADDPQLAGQAPAFAAVRDAIAAARRAVEDVRTALALPAEPAPGLRRRVVAVAEVWAARVEDLRARHLGALSAAATRLPDRDA